MSRQLASCWETGNADAKAKVSWSSLGVSAVIRHDALLYIRRFC